MKTFKKILSLLLVICMITAVFSFTACGKNKGNIEENNGDTNNNGSTETTGKTYTVTVVDGENTPVEGVKLTITDGKSFPSATTDKNGKASVSLPEGTVSVLVTSCDGYEKPAKVSGAYHGVFASGSQELTIKITKKADSKVSYTITVVDQNGDAVVGMEIQLCPGEVCLAEKFYTDENGEITTKLEPGKAVSVKLHELEGYTLPQTVSGDYHAVIAEDETGVTIEVTKN